MAPPKLTQEEIFAAQNLSTGYAAKIEQITNEAHRNLWNVVRDIEKRVDIESRKPDPDRKTIELCLQIKQESLKTLGLPALPTTTGKSE
jgi:hypothetical protein